MAGDLAIKGLSNLVLDDVGQRARGTSQRHVDDDVGVLVNCHPVDQAQIHDIDPELGVNHIAKRLFDVGHVRRGRAGSSGRRVFSSHVGHEFSLVLPVIELVLPVIELVLPVIELLVMALPMAEGTAEEGEVSEMSTPAWVRAAVNAIQPNSAHLTRAGYLETPAKATPSPISSSSPGSAPLLVNILRMAS